MTAISVFLGVLTGLGIGYLYLVVGTAFVRHASAGRCPSCRHGRGLHDRYTGKCAVKVNSARWLHRSLGVRQMTACKCVSEPGSVTA